MEQILTMRNKEIDKLRVIREVLDGKMKKLARGWGTVVVKRETDWILVCACTQGGEQRNYSPVTGATFESSVRPGAGGESVGIGQDTVRRLWTDAGP